MTYYPCAICGQPCITNHYPHSTLDCAMSLREERDSLRRELDELRAQACGVVQASEAK